MRLRELLSLLAEHGVRFTVIGGVALIARGVQRATEDLDIAYHRDPTNLSRLARALAPLHPRLRGVPGDLPFVLDVATLRNGLNFTLDTDLGPLDLLGEVAGLGPYEAVEAAAGPMEIQGAALQVLTLDGLEAAKRAAGRPKDLIDLGYIRALRE